MQIIPMGVGSFGKFLSTDVAVVPHQVVMGTLNLVDA